MRIYPTSSSAAPAHLNPGEDLVLRLEEAHALDVPFGAAADDHLDAAARERLDETALAALGSWREAFDGPLTVEGICLPFVCELPLMRILLAALRAGAGLAAAVDRYGPQGLELVGGSELERGLVAAVAAKSGVPSSSVPAPHAESSTVVGRPSTHAARSPRQRLARAALRMGAPTLLRRGGVLALSYWPLIPLLDRLLDDPDLSVAIPLELRPSGPRRILRAMGDGGWMGHAGPVARRRAGRRLAPAIRRGRALPAPSMVGPGAGFEKAVHSALLDHVAQAGAEHLATASVVRRAYRRRPPRLILATFDTEPFARLVVSLAREAGIRSFLLSHSAYLMPQTLKDMELGDEAAIYSEAVGFPGMRRDRPVHVVGYPLQCGPSSTPTLSPRERARIVVLGQNGHPYTSRFDERIAQRHFIAALGALEAATPEAQVVLRPHPSQDPGPIRAMLERLPKREVAIDAATPLDELVRSADLCVGSLSAGTLQAACAGTPVAVLNVSGFEWRWPLGGDTAVPVAHGEEQLAETLREWSRDGSLPGGEALVSALGADRPGAVERLFELVVAAARRRSGVGAVVVRGHEQREAAEQPRGQRARQQPSGQPRDPGLS